MKIYLFMVLSAFTALCADAQIKKGSILIGGQINFHGSNIEYAATPRTEKNNAAVIKISAGQAIKKNVVMGLIAGYSGLRSKKALNGRSYVTTNFNQYQFGLFFRQYKKLGNSFYFFAEAEASYLTSNQTNFDTTSSTPIKYHRSGGQISLTPGIAYNLTKKLQLELLAPSIAAISYTSSKTGAPGLAYKEKEFRVNSSLNGSPLSNLALGFRIVL